MAVSHDPTYPLFPTFAFLGFVVSLVPLPWHAQAWNSGTCAFMIWSALLCLNGFVNALVWKGNLHNVAPIWCDISSKLIIGGGIGITASTLCISRRLYTLTAIKNTMVTTSDKRRMVIVDLCIAVGIPVIIMVLHVIVQGHRFDLYEDIGCYPVVYNTLPAYFLYHMWPVVLGVCSFVFSSLTLRSFWLRRVQFNELASSNSALNMSRYVRLMMLAMVDIMCSIPLGVYVIYIGNKGIKLQPWISWEDTHFNFGRVGLVPALIWRSDRDLLISIELTRWLPVFCAFLFFGLFGFATEAQKHYKMVFWAAMKPFGLKPAPKSNKVVVPSWAKFTVNSGKPVSPTGADAANLGSKKGKTNSFRSSFGSDVELSTYTGEDTEKSAGLSPTSTAPPHYTDDMYPPTPSTSTAPVSSPLQARKGSVTSLRSTHSDKVYVTPRADAGRPPSPAPFCDVSAAPYHRPYSPPNSYPATQPHPSAQAFAEAVRITVQTESNLSTAV